VKGGSVKSIGLLGLLFVLLMVAYSKVEGGPGEAAQGPDRPVALAALPDTESSGRVPERLSEYLFLHQSRDENLPVHTMASVKACPG